MEINKTFRAKWQFVSECMFLKVTQIIIGKVQLKQSIESILNLFKLKKGKTDNDVLFRMLGAMASSTNWRNIHTQESTWD